MSFLFYFDGKLSQIVVTLFVLWETNRRLTFCCTVFPRRIGPLWRDISMGSRYIDAIRDRRGTFFSAVHRLAYSICMMSPSLNDCDRIWSSMKWYLNGFDIYRCNSRQICGAFFCGAPARLFYMCDDSLPKLLWQLAKLPTKAMLLLLLQLTHIELQVAQKQITIRQSCNMLRDVEKWRQLWITK